MHQAEGNTNLCKFRKDLNLRSENFSKVRIFTHEVIMHKVITHKVHLYLTHLIIAGWQKKEQKRCLYSPVCYLLMLNLHLCEQKINKQIKSVSVWCLFKQRIL